MTTKSMIYINYWSQIPQTHTDRVVEDTEKQLHVDINKSIANGAEISVNQ